MAAVQVGHTAGGRTDQPRPLGAGRAVTQAAHALVIPCPGLFFCGDLFLCPLGENGVIDRAEVLIFIIKVIYIEYVASLPDSSSNYLRNSGCWKLGKFMLYL